jgi:hypothetical protein
VGWGYRGRGKRGGLGGVECFVDPMKKAVERITSKVASLFMCVAFILKISGKSEGNIDKALLGTES